MKKIDKLKGFEIGNLITINGKKSFLTEKGADDMGNKINEIIKVLNELVSRKDL